METGMDRIWLKSYPDGVPADIDVDRYPSLVALLEESFARFRDRKVLVCMDKAITYGELDNMSVALGAFLQGAGLAKGARVAIMLPNVPQNPISSAAILRAGYAVVNVNPLYTARELEHQLVDSGAEAIVLLENSVEALEKAVARTSIKLVIVDNARAPVDCDLVRLRPACSKLTIISFDEALAAGRQRKFIKPDMGPDDVAFLQYTGGTTGVAKGATLLQRNVLANVLQCEAWFQPSRRPVDDQLLVVCALPLYHIFALTVCYLAAVRIGGVNLLIPNPRDMDSFVKELQKYQISWFPAVNTLYNALLHHPEFEKVDFSKLSFCPGAGMAVQKPVAEAWHRLTGCAIVEAYGLSETSPGLTCNLTNIDGFTGSIGLPLPSTYISIRDNEGCDLPVGAAGEICACGPQLMAGYWGRPVETERAMTSDGYFRTGDIGVMSEDGFIRIVDRKKDMILVSGFNVYPTEIEGVIAGHPGVLECTVIGVPDEYSTEAVKAFVVKKDPTVAERDIVEFAATQLAKYKVPKHVEFRTELPKTNIGKILRRGLRQEG
jgi:long-chain acyl-CoA synthetase